MRHRIDGPLVNRHVVRQTDLSYVHIFACSHGSWDTDSSPSYVSVVVRHPSIRKWMAMSHLQGRHEKCGARIIEALASVVAWALDRGCPWQAVHHLHTCAAWMELQCTVVVIDVHEGTSCRTARLCCTLERECRAQNMRGRWRRLSGFITLSLLTRLSRTGSHACIPCQDFRFTLPYDIAQTLFGGSSIHISQRSHRVRASHHVRPPAPAERASTPGTIVDRYRRIS